MLPQTSPWISLSDKLTGLQNVTDALSGNASTAVLSYDRHSQYQLAQLVWKIGAPLLLAIGTVGSVLSILVLRRPRLRNVTTTFYLAVLAVADLGVLYMGLLRLWLGHSFKIYLRLKSNSFCRLHTFLDHVIEGFAAWVLVAVTVDRCISVCAPFAAKRLCTVNRARLVVLVIAATLTLVNMHYFFTVSVLAETRNHIAGDGFSACFTSTDRRVAFFLEKVWPWIDLFVINFLPFIVMVVANLLLARQLALSARRLRRHTSISIIGHPRSSIDVNPTIGSGQVSETKPLNFRAADTGVAKTKTDTVWEEDLTKKDLFKDTLISNVVASRKSTNMDGNPEIRKRPEKDTEDAAKQQTRPVSAGKQNRESGVDEMKSRPNPTAHVNAAGSVASQAEASLVSAVVTKQPVGSSCHFKPSPKPDLCGNKERPGTSTAGLKSLEANMPKKIKSGVPQVTQHLLHDHTAGDKQIHQKEKGNPQSLWTKLRTTWSGTTTAEKKCRFATDECVQLETGKSRSLPTVDKLPPARTFGRTPPLVASLSTASIRTSNSSFLTAHLSPSFRSEPTLQRTFSMDSVISSAAILMVAASSIRQSVVSVKRMAESPQDRFNIPGLTAMMLAVNTVFVLLTAPVAIFMVGPYYWVPYADGREQAKLLLIWAVVNMLQYTNNSLHFFLFCLTGSRFRAELLTMCGHRRASL